MRILVTDDDATLVALVRRLLEEEGYAVDAVGTREEARVLAMVNAYDALLIDLNLPDGNGIPLIQSLRRDGCGSPIMVLSGSRDTPTVVRALDAGADDYVAKPLVFDEFRARVRALVRRGGAYRTEQIGTANVVLNRLTRRVLVDGEPLALTPRQLAILEHLLLRTGEVVTRTELLEKVFDLSFDPGTNVVDANVSRLRRALADAGAVVKIEARRGIGFVLSAGGR